MVLLAIGWQSVHGQQFESTPAYGLLTPTSAGVNSEPLVEAKDVATRELESLNQRVAALEHAEASGQSDKQPASVFPTYKMTGFMHLDTAFYAQDGENRAVVGDAQDGTGFRRARLAVTGKVAESTGYQLEMDFATAGRPSFFDCYIEQNQLPLLGSVRVGQFCQPFSVDSLTGFRNLTFLERSLPFLALVPFRRVGISASNTFDDDQTTFAISGYRSGGFNNAPLGDDRFATDIGDIGGYSLSTRMTRLLQYDSASEGRCMWHIGGGFNFSMLGANDAFGSGLAGNAGSPRPFYQARTSPEFGLLGYPEIGNTFGNAVNGTPTFVDTGRYEAASYNLFGLETVAQRGAWGFTAEYMASVVNSVVGPVTYQGGYAQLAYRLTGEHRAYDTRTATLGRLRPNANFRPLKNDGVRGWGAWELAARYSIIDLTNPTALDGHYYQAVTNAFDGSAEEGGIGNGLLQDTTLGLTWFLNVHTKLQVNWIHAMLDNSRFGSSDAELFVGRFHLDF